MSKTASDSSEDKPNKKSFLRRWGKYAAAGAFMFFLLKGIGWLVLLGLAVWGITG